MDELARVIGGLEEAIKNSNKNHASIMGKLDGMDDSIGQFKADTHLRLTSVEADLGALKKLRDRAYMILAFTGVGGGTIGAGSGTGLSKLAKWFAGG